GFIRADQSTSFQAMERRIKRFLDVVQQDPAVEYVTGFTGGGQANSANMFMSLKPMAERKVSSDEVINRLREKLKDEPGARLF
ncbi:efflux RND transporter permease subunit, partial [Klebsiella pneumoniae]|uniref:efflux RND transporter permease subunit n=2 Tax=Pseudomonadota TaxID=1224 RepID=UPI0021CAF7FF